ncbi:brct domain [Pyrenophora seminiperda CCB06]|uniref:Brct domain n=1 Tax=Pyrenophora seminiperda CCB06 TaxID=1302712 RepID=A0A3M7M776_9PLEO|nr:brct domain [Pyrenophora seminiperda CCB06]
MNGIATMWTLVTSDADTTSGSTAFSLPDEGVAHITLGTHSTQVGVVRRYHPTIDRELGRINTGPFGVKVEAVTETLTIVPGVGTGSGPPTAKYELQPPVSGRTESIFLRHGDFLAFSSLESSLICKWTDSEVQVNSSAADFVQVAGGPDAKLVPKTPEEDTAGEDLNNHATAKSTQRQKKSHPRATPQLPEQRSLVIQETPTATRVNGSSAYLDANPPELTNQVAQPVKETVSLLEDGSLAQDLIAPSVVHASSSTHQTTEISPHHNKRKVSPKVKIPPRSTRKRSTPEDTESGHEALRGCSKRAKTSDDDTQDSRLSNVAVIPSKKSSTTKVAAEAEEMTPTRSQRSSRRSTTVAPESYNGPVPRMACSNSTITKTHHAVKFLRKQGGAFVESLDDDFDVLCVRDGGLQKKPKVLYAIARGIPIVTDKWLLGSAKAGHLLPFADFKPSVSKQEKEWNFSLDDVFGRPQTPFEGCNIHFTKSLKTTFESFAEIEAVCKAAGAESVTSTKANRTGDSIVLANNEDDDVDAQKLIKEGTKCYTKDLLIYSILRGALDLDSDDFKIKGTATAKTPSKEKKKRGRKSV